MAHVGAGSTAGATSWWRTRTGSVVIGSAFAAAYYFLREYSGHALGILLMCQAMHLVMQHGHGGAAPDASSSPTV